MHSRRQNGKYQAGPDGNCEAEEQKTSVKNLMVASSAAAVKINLPTHENTLGMTQHETEKKNNKVIFTAKLCGFVFSFWIPKM